MPNERTSSAVLVWLEITIGIVTGSSPRRCRQSSSSRQWSEVDARIAMRLGTDWSVSVHSRPSGVTVSARSASISGIAAARSGRWKTTRWKNVAAVGVVGVLIERDDVAVVAGDQRCHGSDDARPVRTVHDQTGVVAQGFVVHSHG